MHSLFLVFALFKVAYYLSLYYPQVVFGVCALAGPEQEVRAGGQEPQNGGSHKRTASRSRQNQSWGRTLHRLCAFLNPPGCSECLFYCAHMRADVGRVHEEGDSVFKGILQWSRPCSISYFENHHYMSQCSLVSHIS